MLDLLSQKRTVIAELCRRHGVQRLDVFGSAARAADFDPGRSDIDLLVQFRSEQSDLGAIVELQEDLEGVLQRPVDLVERAAVEQSRNHLRRVRILGEARLLYAA
jgi:predicted nucleotidyltransferase